MENRISVKPGGIEGVFGSDESLVISLESVGVLKKHFECADQKALLEVFLCFIKILWVFRQNRLDSKLNFKELYKKK